MGVTVLLFGLFCAAAGIGYVVKWVRGEAEGPEYFFAIFLTPSGILSIVAAVATLLDRGGPS